MAQVDKETKKVLYPLIEFYLSLVAYFILHMIFVIASDFVEAFNIPPLNIGIYVDKLAAIRALLMVLADFIEWGITQKGCGDGGNANQSLFQQQTDKDKDDWFTGTTLRVKNPKEESQKDDMKHWNNDTDQGGARRWASIISFVGMLVCRIVYLILLYKSDNKSLSVFITLCLEGFWFGLFQMGFFAIGPEFNAYTSFGIHTMGNVIFFLQVILNYYAKFKPKINSLYRVRVHAWIVVITSIIGLLLWLCFCFWANAGHGGAPSTFPAEEDVWSPFLLFIIGAFAEDFAVPGILPFAFLDPEKANLVNYLTPSFFMTGALVTVIFNDWWSTSNFKDWSSSTNAYDGEPWHSMWLLNIPKYIAFFIAMWSIHGTYADLRCIIQSRWRVMWLTMTVVVPRAVLETSGYVGVANWAIGRGNPTLGGLAKQLNTQGINSTDNLNTASTVSSALSNATTEIKDLISKMFPEVKGVNSVSATDETNTINVTLVGDTSGSPTEQGDAAFVKGKVKIQIKADSSKVTGLDDQNGPKIAKALAGACRAAPNASGGTDFNAFDWIAWHDVTAMFCRFVYGKFAVGYK